MKKLIFFLMLSFSIGMVASAQTTDKVKETSTIPQKVHNTFSKHKEHNGYVSKHKGPHHKRKHKHTTEKNIIKKD